MLNSLPEHGVVAVMGANVFGELSRASPDFWSMHA
jgi:hypothetical protein